MNTITKTKTIYCPECAKGDRREVSRDPIKQILYAESFGGSRIVRVGICPHLTVDETFDIENPTQEDASPS